ncbi:secretin and TonB N-terminal domain-containing protein [Pyxidicoccus parkwayensis]|uniref:Secretin and TonB N-terminal domain-containing protein n=1 Tax=Pyxidicoccus parkwayensis TaxID=2813578 RepID=A0ABX7NVG9_9BACT|nr:secretin and TonB N-terminal domain-containing protein [Pyxidicoccus parkwaysis]QSQ21475.1 secretin and TonB N-terminal domain-containing protein [Pyxidicoccus parkwaysis]
MSRVRAAVLALALLGAPSFAASPKAEGKRVTVDIVRADIHNVLRMLADMGRLNLVVDDEVQGTVTLRLRNVPWKQALETVLSSHGLGRELQGDVLRVAPLSKLKDEAELRVKLKQAREDAAPLRTYFIPVNYARAADLVPHVQAQLSPRGSVSVDARTNTLIVTDVEPVSLP